MSRATVCRGLSPCCRLTQIVAADSTALVFLNDASEEDIDELAVEIKMLRPHSRTLKRAWRELRDPMDAAQREHALGETYGTLSHGISRAHASERSSQAELSSRLQKAEARTMRAIRAATADRPSSPSASTPAGRAQVSDRLSPSSQQARPSSSAASGEGSAQPRASALESVFSMMEDKKLRVRDLFRSLDRDGSGSIDATELREAFARHDIPLRAGDVRELMQALDQDGDGEVDTAEFMEQMRKAKHEQRNPTAPVEGQAPSTAASPRSAERRPSKVVFDMNGRSHQVWHVSAAVAAGRLGLCLSPRL